MQPEFMRASGTAAAIAKVCAIFDVPEPLEPARPRSASGLIDDLAETLRGEEGEAPARVLFAFFASDLPAIQKLRAMKDFMMAHGDVRQQFEEWRA